MARSEIESKPAPSSSSPAAASKPGTPSNSSVSPAGSSSGAMAAPKNGSAVAVAPAPRPATSVPVATMPQQTATPNPSKPVVPKPAESRAEDKEKQRALGLAVQQIEKTYGKGSIMKMDEAAYIAIPGISTGCLSLDLALGGKGIPRGRIIEIFGPESSGKTTLALTVAAMAQKDGGVAAVIDAEHAMDPVWSRKLGVNIDNLLVSQPDSGEQALEICELLVRSNAVDVIIVDSVAALIPKAEIEGEMGDAIVGVQARLMSQAMRKLTGIIARSNCTVIFINQIREKIGVMYGSPETTTGGRALKFYASVRIDIRRTGAIKEGEVTIGSRTRARVVKNKVAPPFREAEFDIMYDSGISGEGDLVDLGVDANVVQKSGAWYSYGEIRVGQGREAAKQFLKDNAELAKDIRKKVLAIKMAQAASKPSAKPSEDEPELD